MLLTFFGGITAAGRPARCTYGKRDEADTGTDRNTDKDTDTDADAGVEQDNASCDARMEGRFQLD